MKKIERGIMWAAAISALVPIIYRPDAKRPFGHSRIRQRPPSFEANGSWLLFLRCSSQ